MRRGLGDRQRDQAQRIRDDVSAIRDKDGDLTSDDVGTSPGAHHSSTSSTGSSRDHMEPRPEFLDENGEIDWSGAPRGGYTLDAHGNPITHEHVPQAGDRFDRYGEPSGRYVSPVSEEGAFPYETRSLPYFENPDAYHEYEWVRSPADIHDVYAELDGPRRTALDAMLIKYDLTLSDLGRVLRGEASPAFGQPGGATQDLLPTTVEMLCKLGLVREV